MDTRHSWLGRAVDGLAAAIVIAAPLVTGGRLLMVASGDRGLARGPAERVIPLEDFMEATAMGHWLGPRTASVVVLVYGDYACGFSSEVHQTLQALRHRYPEHLAIVWKHFVAPSLTPYFAVVLAAECAAEQGRFAEFHAAALEAGPKLHYWNAWALVAEAVEVPDLREFERCVESRRHVQRIRTAYERAADWGVSLTPTLFVNGRMVVGSAPSEYLDTLVAGQFPGRRTLRSR